MSSDRFIRFSISDFRRCSKTNRLVETPAHLLIPFGVGHRAVFPILMLLVVLSGCTPREEGAGATPEASGNEAAGVAGELPADGVPEAGVADSDAPARAEDAGPTVEDASGVIVYPDGGLRRIYPRDYSLGPLATAEVGGRAMEMARRFLRALAAGDVDQEILLPESRFMLNQTLGREDWPGIDSYRLGEPISMAPGVVSIPVILYSQGRRGVTEIYVESNNELWYISEFPVFPGMFDRDDGANQPTELFDPRSPQL